MCGKYSSFRFAPPDKWSPSLPSFGLSDLRLTLALTCDGAFVCACRRTDRLGRGELQELNGCSIVKYERNTNSNRRLGRRDQNLPTFKGFV